MEERHDRVVLQKRKECFQLQELQIIIDDSLGYTIAVYGWFLPEDHELYTSYLRLINNVTVSDLVREIECHLICPGVSPNELTGEVIPHVVPKVVDPLYYSDDGASMNMFPKNSTVGPLTVHYSAAHKPSSAQLVWNMVMQVSSKQEQRIGGYQNQRM